MISQIGGGQENGLRGGTENVPGIFGLGVACSHRCKGLHNKISFLKSLRDQFESKLSNLLVDIKVNGREVERVANTSNITFFGVDGMALVARLAERKIFCSQVSACSTGKPEPSKTLLAMGLSHKDAYSTVRFAFSIKNKPSEVDAAVNAIFHEVSELRKIWA